MMNKIAFYISGHGYGHATRVVEIIRSLGKIDGEWQVYVRTGAPQGLFRAGLGVMLEFRRVVVDAEVVETDDTLRVDPRATVESVVAFRRRWARIVDSEASFIRREGISLIVADIPYLAGEVAA